VSCVLALSLSASAFADCSGKKYDQNQKADSKDPCGEKKMKTVGGGVGATAGLVHGVAAAICISCYQSAAGAAASTANCKYGSATAGTSDIVGTIGTQAATASVTKKFDAAGGAGAAVGAAGGGKSIYDTIQMKNPTGDSADAVDSRESECSGAAFTNTLAMAGQAANSGMAFADAGKAGENKKGMTGNHDKIDTSVSKGNGKDAKSGAAAGGSGDATASGDFSEDSTHDLAMRASAATLAAGSEVFDIFEKQTGKPASLIFDKLAEGAPNSLIAAAQAIGDENVIKEAYSLSAMAENTLANTPGLRETIEANAAAKTGAQPPANQEFASTAKAATKEHADNGLGDLAGALAGLLNPDGAKKEDPRNNQ
jgi:hypothetical protein